MRYMLLIALAIALATLAVPDAHAAKNPVGITCQIIWHTDGTLEVPKAKRGCDIPPVSKRGLRR